MKKKFFKNLGIVFGIVVVLFLAVIAIVSGLSNLKEKESERRYEVSANKEIKNSNVSSYTSLVDDSKSKVKIYVVLDDKNQSFKFYHQPSKNMIRNANKGLEKVTFHKANFTDIEKIGSGIEGMYYTPHDDQEEIIEGSEENEKGYNFNALNGKPNDKGKNGKYKYTVYISDKSFPETDFISGVRKDKDDFGMATSDFNWSNYMIVTSGNKKVKAKVKMEDPKSNNRMDIGSIEKMAQENSKSKMPLDEIKKLATDYPIPYYLSYKSYDDKPQFWRTIENSSIDSDHKATLVSYLAVNANLNSGENILISPIQYRYGIGEIHPSDSFIEEDNSDAEKNYDKMTNEFKTWEIDNKPDQPGKLLGVIRSGKPFASEVASDFDFGSFFSTYVYGTVDETGISSSWEPVWRK